MNETFAVTGLQIVGYANRLEETMLPRVVPPIFRATAGPERVLMPPYVIRFGTVYNAVEVTPAELEAMRRDGKVTVIEGSLQAKPDHELWIATDWQVNYEPVPIAAGKLREIALQNIRDASAAIQKGDFELAHRHCEVAISADDRMVDPLAISAAIARRENDKGTVRLMEKLAEGLLIAPDGFEMIVKGYELLLPEPGGDGAPSPGGGDLQASARHLMGGMAGLHREDCLV